MRIKTIAAWIFLGASLVFAGLLLHMAQVTEFARFLGAMGVLYFGIGVILNITHDRHMAKPVQASRE